MFLIRAMLVSVEGHWDQPRGWLWSIRTTDGLRSSKMKRVMIVLMYACWEIMIVCQMKLQVIFIPSNQVQGPKSVSLYISFISTLNWLISSLELPVTKQLLMWTAKMMTCPFTHFLMKVPWLASMCWNPSFRSASRGCLKKFSAHHVRKFFKVNLVNPLPPPWEFWTFYRDYDIIYVYIS